MKQMKKGMTIVGVVIASGILATSMITLVDYQNTLNRIRFQQQYVSLGSLLASEGVELARGVRDSNFAPNNRLTSGMTWDRGLSNGVYAIDYTLDLNGGMQNITSCREEDINETCRLQLDPITSLYQHSSVGVEQELQVYRFVSIEDTGSSNPNEKKVVSTVILRSRNNAESQYKAATILYNTDL